MRRKQLTKAERLAMLAAVDALLVRIRAMRAAEAGHVIQ